MGDKRCCWRLRTGVLCRRYRTTKGDASGLFCSCHAGVGLRSALQIQKWWRSRVWREKINCVNRTDFETLETIWVISPKNWVSWVQDGCLYGASRQSLQRWLSRFSRNPYTNQEIGFELLRTLWERVNSDDCYYEEEPKWLWENASYQEMVIHLSHLLSMYYGYCVPCWIMELSVGKWVDWVNELNECPRSLLSQCDCLDAPSPQELWYIVGDTIEEKKRLVLSWCIQCLTGHENEDVRKTVAVWMMRCLARFVPDIPGMEEEGQVQEPLPLSPPPRILRWFQFNL